MWAISLYKQYPFPPAKMNRCKESPQTGTSVCQLPLNYIDVLSPVPIYMWYSWGYSVFWSLRAYYIDCLGFSA